jgi:Protein of unknown function (DUF2889)
MSVVTIAGSVRDLLTTDAGATVRGKASLAIALSAGGLIERIDHEPAKPSCEALLGKRIGFGFRSGVKDLLGDLSGTLLGFLIEDLSGAPAASGYGAIRERTLLGQPDPPIAQGTSRGGRADVCAGWRANGRPYGSVVAGAPLPFEAEPPVAPDLGTRDPLGWHSMPPLAARQSRRVRRLDLWREGDQLFVDTMFRDSTADPDLTPRVVHEYTLNGVLDTQTLQVLEIQVEPRVLPFPTDCPFAADSAQLVVGEPVGSIRETVRTLSVGPVSCTHLNDALRVLADIVTMVSFLSS